VATKNEKLSALQRQVKELTEQQEELNESADHFLDIGEKALATTTDRLDLQREELDQEAKKAGMQREQIALATQKIELQRNAQGELSAANEEALKVLEQKDKWLKQHAVVLKEQAKSLHYQKEIAQASLSAFDSIASKMMISQSSTAAAAKNMFVMWKNAVKVEGVIKGTYKSLKAIGGSFLDIFNPMNLITSGMKAIFTEAYEYMMRSSTAMANFSKATGDAGEMTKDLGAAMNFAAGVDIEAVAAAGGALAGAWTGMADASGAVRSSVIGMTAELERMGQSGGDTGKSLNFMTKGMGMSMPAAQDAMKGLASSAKDLGQSPAQIGSNFRAMAGTLALYGGRILDKFTDIAAMAKATGLEMTDIATIGEGFDTFEGAASKVGQLNALVGGPMLDSMEMLRLQSEKGPEAVTEAVIESLKAQGKSYETMGYQEVKAISETLGISGDKFAMMMGYQSEEMKAAAEKAKKEQKFQDRYNRMLRSTVSLAEQIKLAMTAIFGNEQLQAAMKGLIGVFIKGGMEGKEVFTEIAKVMTTAILKLTKFAKWFIANVMPHIEKLFLWLGKTGKKDGKDGEWDFGFFKADNWQVALAGLAAFKLGLGGMLVGAVAKGLWGAGAWAVKGAGNKLLDVVGGGAAKKAAEKAAQKTAAIAAEKTAAAAAQKTAAAAAQKTAAAAAQRTAAAAAGRTVANTAGRTVANTAGSKIAQEAVKKGILRQGAGFVARTALTSTAAAGAGAAGAGAGATALALAGPLVIGAAVAGGIYMASEVVASKQEEEKTTRNIEAQALAKGHIRGSETVEEAAARYKAINEKRLRDHANANKMGVKRKNKVTATAGTPTAKETAQ